MPAFNEAERLPETLARLSGYLLDCPWTSRVVVVDNGSSDETAGVATAIKNGAVDIVAVDCSRPGKGAAVRRGLLSSTSSFVGFMDADLSTPVETIWRAVRALRQGGLGELRPVRGPQTPSPRPGRASGPRRSISRPAPSSPPRTGPAAPPLRTTPEPRSDTASERSQPVIMDHHRSPGQTPGN